MLNTEYYKTTACFEFTDSGSQCQIKITYTVGTVVDSVRPGAYPEQPNLRISESFPTRKEASAYGKGVVDYYYYVEIEDDDTALSNLSKLGTLSSEEEVAYRQGWKSQQATNTP